MWWIPLIQMGLQVMAGGEAEKAQRKQAVAYRIAAVRARLKADDDARAIERQGLRFQANQAAGFAKSGVMLDSGSPLAVLMDTAINVERNAKKTRLMGDWNAEGYEAGSEIYDKMADNSGMAGIYAAAGTFLSAKADAAGDYSASSAMRMPSVGNQGVSYPGGHNWNSGGGQA